MADTLKTPKVAGGTSFVGVGDPAPDVVLAAADGTPVHLADFWQAGPVVLVFSRHLG
jgi:peroxiredoxin